MKKFISNKFNNSIFVFFAGTFCCLLWGSAFPMIKVGYNVLNILNTNTSDIILFAGIRFFIAGVITIFIHSIASHSYPVLKRGGLKKITVLALFQTVLQYIFFYLGLAFSDGSRASVINGSSVFFALIISSVIFKQENLTLSKFLGTLVGFLGVIVAGINGIKNSGNIQIGDIFILFSAISYAFSSVFIKKYSAEEQPELLSGYQFTLGGAFMVMIALIFGGHIIFNFKGIIIILYLSFVSAVAYTLWSILLKYNNVSKITIYGSLTPIFGFVLSLLLLRENTSDLMVNIVGLTLVAIGIAIVNKQKNKAVH